MKKKINKNKKIRKLKFIVFGDLPLATKIVKFMLTTLNVELVGVVVSDKKINNNDPWNEMLLQEYSSLNNIKRYTLH